MCWNLLWKVPQGPHAGDLVLSKLLQDGSCLQEAKPSGTWSLSGTVTSGHFLPLSVSLLPSGEQPDPHVCPIMMHHVLSHVQKQQGQGAWTESAEPTSKPFRPTGRQVLGGAIQGRLLVGPVPWSLPSLRALQQTDIFWFLILKRQCLRRDMCYRGWTLTGRSILSPPTF